MTTRIIATLPVGFPPEAQERGDVPGVEAVPSVWPIVRDILLRNFQRREAQRLDESLRAARGRVARAVLP